MKLFSLFGKKPKDTPVVVPQVPEQKTTMSIRYSYEWKDDVPESERDTAENPSRPFCKKLMELKRLYTRADIERISERLGYSVFDRCGGDDCRHVWKSQLVVKKG